jgi:predicted ATPase/class 3 adenylate cyclase
MSIGPEAPNVELSSVPESRGTVINVTDWLRQLGLERYEAAFAENDVTADVLPVLTAEDLKDLGVTAVGHRRRLLQAVAALHPDRAGVPTAQQLVDNRTAVDSAAERRQLSVMFCDLVGSTELSARLDPEDLSQVIRIYQARVRETVTRFGGFIARYVGDGVLIYFGWPEARETEAEWAVRAALAVVAAVADMPIRGEKLEVRIGVATGLVVVGELVETHGGPQQTAIGETPNRAARLQGIAEPSCVVIDTTTYRHVGRLFEYHDLGAVALKGLPNPVSAWSVRGESGLESRFEALRPDGLTPLVGRQEELDLLVRRWRQAAKGNAKVVLISGEPGIGKSRLLVALEQRMQNEPCTLRFFCSPHHREHPLYPIIEHLKHAADFSRSDTPSAMLGKLQALLGCSRGSDRNLLLLADLLSIPVEGISTLLNLSPQRRKELMFEALIRRLDALAESRPVLMLVEDMHWADPSTRELFDLTIERLVGRSILLVMTFRSEFDAPWIGRADVSLMALSRLTRNDTASMTARVASRAIPSALIERVAEQADGVPLFIEELTRAVIEAGPMAAEAETRLAVPGTLHASLLARLDRLARGKSVAQVGAVIGRTFSFELLAKVAGMPEPELREGLTQLADSGLVLERGVPPKASYIFKHSLVQDAAYETLLRGRRATLHERVAEALLQLDPEATELQAGLLAHHCAEAGLIDQAIDYWLKAGHSALSRSAVTEAVAVFQRGLRSLDKLSDPVMRLTKESDLQLALGGAFLITHGQASSKARDALRRAREICKLTEDPSRIISVSWGLWQYQHNRAELDASVEDAVEVLQLASDRRDAIAELIGHRCMATSMLLLAKHSTAREHYDRTIALEADIPRDLIDKRLSHPRFTSGTALSIYSWLLLFQGQLDQALMSRHTALAKTRASEDLHALAVTLHQSCAFYQMLGDLSTVEAQSTELISLAAEQGFTHWHGTGTIFRGWCMAARGEHEAGLAEMRRGLTVKQSTGAELKVPYYLGLIASFVAKTATEDAMELIAEALARVERTGERWFEAELHRLAGELLLEGHETTSTGAEDEFHRAIAIARGQGARFWELGAATSLAHLWCNQGRREDAQKLLSPIYGWFAEAPEMPEIEKARALLWSLA